MTGNTIAHTYGTGGTYTVCATAHNSCGTHQFCTSLDITGLGVHAAGSLPDLNVYPNPTNGLLSIKGLQSETNYLLYLQDQKGNTARVRIMLQ